MLHLAGQPGPGDRAWLAVSVIGLAFAAWAVADSLRRRRAGVDVIALLALAGALAVGELLAGAVITVMLASGRALEGWAAGRARRDLTALLERAPRTAHRYPDGALAWCRSPTSARRPAAGRAGRGRPRRWARRSAACGPGRVGADRRAAAGRACRTATRSAAARSTPAAPFDLRATTTRRGQHLCRHRPAGREAQASQAPFVRLADRYAAAFVPLTLAVAGVAWGCRGMPCARWPCWSWRRPAR